MPTFQVQVLKLLSYALMGAPLLIALALTFVLGFGERQEGVLPALEAMALVGLLGVLAHAMASAAYKQVPPLGLGLSGEAVSVAVAQRVQANMMLRLVCCELPLIAGIVLALMSSGFALSVALLGVAVGELLLALHVFPNSWNLARVEARLDSAGARSDLRKSFSVAS